MRSVGGRVARPPEAGGKSLEPPQGGAPRPALAEIFGNVVAAPLRVRIDARLQFEQVGAGQTPPLHAKEIMRNHDGTVQEENA